MRIQPLIQSELFDVADWESDTEFAVFPQGARAKDAVFAPMEPIDPVIVAGKRYLFKRSKRSYPDQFWGEVVAYRIGCLMGVQVPPAFVAYNSKTGHCAALIEWFYSDGKELFIMGGDFLQKIQPDFDRKYGTQHNLIDNSVFIRVLTRNKTLETNWRQWWVDALLFDALIGNTDRHQDNWGLIFFRSGDESKCRLAPLFDNGTSLGHERFPERVRGWRDVDVANTLTKAITMLSGPSRQISL
ncbi:MAG TPA: HipA domain-containing protein [Gallionella sp.]|nr:HipA domain-containing protein [Gallionella sp.]